MTFGLCRALGTHAWRLVPPIVVVKGGRRIVLHCERCRSWRVETWAPHGAIEHRSYERTPEYQTYLKEYDRGGARSHLLEGQKETEHADNHPHLRLVHGGKRGKGPSRLRGRHAHTRKRTAEA